MEKNKSKNKFLKFLPKATSSVKFQNQLYSPKIHAGKGFSVPCTSIIPAEARRNHRNSTTNFETQEPTSPKVSCMGQIKHNKKMMIKKEKLDQPSPRDSKPVSSIMKEKKKNRATYLNVLFNRAKPQQSKKSDSSFEKSSNFPDRATSFSQMRQFASGRETIREFDWGAEVKPVEENVEGYYSDEESEGEERGELIPFSAPILGGGGVMTMQPRKEINLWKRRIMTQQLRPLQIKSMIKS